jgi:glycerophosphoryl diester phosphodiesterase
VGGGVALVVILTSVRPMTEPERLASKTPATTAPREHGPPFAKQLWNMVWVIGHRGNSSQLPENTVAAINDAFAVGAGMVEIDVHFSRDRVPVVIHDETVERTTNGKGLVAQLTLARLKTLDAGSWSGRKYAGERIPTLAEALQAATGKGPLLLDLKVEGLGAAVANVLRRLDLPDTSVAIGTWTPSQTSDFVRHVPGAQILMTSGEALKRWDPDYFQSERARGVTGFEILVDNLTEPFITAAHAHGMPVYAFTVNEEATMRRLIAMGVDGIETDYPAVLSRVVNAMSRP